MDLDEAFYIIEGIFTEYMDSRTYQRYLFDNLLLQFDGKGIGYLDYVNQSKKAVSEPTDYVKTKVKNEDLLEKFKLNNVTIQ